MGTGYKTSLPSLRVNPRESGLVDGWNLGDPVNGVVYGAKGNNGTIVGVVSTISSPLGMSMKCFPLEYMGYIDLTNSITLTGSPFTILTWIKPDADAGVGFYRRIISWTTVFTFDFVYRPDVDVLAFYDNAAWRSSAVIQIEEKWVLASLRYDGAGTYSMLVNGDSVYSANTGAATITGTPRIGNRTTGAPATALNWNGAINTVAIYNKYLQDNEIRAHYLAVRTAGWKTTYDVAVSSADEGGVIADQLGRASGSPAPMFFGDTTGRWRIETDTIQGKRNCKIVANRTALGSLYVPTALYNQNPTEAAFGTPEGWFYIPAASICYWMLEASYAGAWNNAAQNGYRVTFDGTTGTISLHRITAGAVAETLYVSGAGVFTAASWFKYSRPRTTAGVFTGKVNDVTHNATGGGANPSAADVTHTTSTYQIFQNTTAVGAKFSLCDPSGGHCMWKGVI